MLVDMQMCRLHDRAPFSRQDIIKLFSVLITGSWNQEGMLSSYQTLLSEVCVICGNITRSRWLTKCFFFAFETHFQHMKYICIWYLQQYYYIYCSRYYFCNNNFKVIHFYDNLTDLLWHLFVTSWTFWELILKKIRHPVPTECFKMWLISNQENYKCTCVVHLTDLFLYVHICIHGEIKLA
jgi:hypothetical protein